MGKPVIIITRNEEDVPFDLKALRYRYYNTEDPFWGGNLRKAIKDMIVELLKETEYGYVFEGISLEGDIKYIRRKTRIEKPKIPVYSLEGVWEGTMKLELMSPNDMKYKCNMHLVQKDQELSGTLTVSYMHEKQKKKHLTVVQEMIVGEVKKRTVRLHAISYSFIQQGLETSYGLDAFMGKLLAGGDAISGNFKDKRGIAGVFSFKRVKAKRES